MAEKLHRFPSGRGARHFLGLAIVMAAVLLPYIYAQPGYEDTRLAQAAPLCFSDGWSAETEGGLLPLSSPSRPEAGAVHERLRLVNTLPEALEGNDCICFQTKNETVQISVDGETIYSYGKTPQLLFGRGVGAVWNIAELPAGSGGGTIEIELIPVDQRTGLEPYEFLLGGRDCLVTYLLERSFSLLMICLIMAVIGLVTMVMATVSMIRREKRAASLLDFTFFMGLATVWTATDSGLLQFVLRNKGVVYMLFGSSFYLFCAPFALFIADLVPEKKRLFRSFAVVSALYALLRILLLVFFQVSFETGLWLLHLLMAVMICTTNVVLWRPVIRARRFVWDELPLAVTAFTLVSAAALISFYIEDKLDMQRNQYSSSFYVGILIFALITIFGAARKNMSLRQRAFKAEFFRQRAYTDELTGLMNVKGFDDNCPAALASAAPGELCVLLDFDVNFFSQYNANNGLDAGDALLKRIAGVLQRLCRPGELAARQEADHYVCLLKGESLESIIDRVRESDSQSRAYMSQRMLLLSYGLVQVTDPGLSVAAMRNQALVAKRTIKGKYENNIAVYDHDIHELQLRERSIISGLDRSLEQREYVIYLQPKIRVDTGGLGGAEALVRRIGEDGSVMAAGEIIDVLERGGFVAKLDFYILGLVCAFIRSCLDQGLPICPISSNFSRVHLYDPDFPGRVAEIVDSFSVPHELVEVELTETSFLAGKDALGMAVQQLHGCGFKVSIDDFGSGYSSLNMLKDVDVDSVKLDREFLAEFEHNRRSGVIIKHTLRLAQEMGIVTVAEGIETAEQLDFLRRQGCDLVQGFYYSRPIPLEDFCSRYMG